MVSERDQMTARVDGIGAAGVAKLRESRVLVVGAGGLGSPVLAYLAAAGVGTIGISDDDRVELSNLQRQVIHPEANLGQVKSASAARTLAALNSAVTVRPEPHLTPANAAALIGAYDLVVDATDNFPAKYLISDTASGLNVPDMWGTLVGMSFQASLFADGLTLRDLYPSPPPEGSTATSATNGVLGAVCGQAGSLMAGEVVKYLTGVGTPLIGKLLIVDAAAAKWNVVDFTAAAPAPLAAPAPPSAPAPLAAPAPPSVPPTPNPKKESD